MAAPAVYTEARIKTAMRKVKPASFGQLITALWSGVSGGRNPGVVSVATPAQKKTILSIMPNIEKSFTRNSAK